MSDIKYIISAEENEEIVKKVESDIRTKLDKALKEYYDKEKDNYNTKHKLTDWRNEIKQCPSVDIFEYGECDLPIIQLDYKDDIYENDQVFFQYEFIKWFNESNNDLLKLFKFTIEDFPGIFIEPKRV